MNFRLSVAILLLVIPLRAICYEDRPSAPIVSSGDDGTCYARSVPKEVSGSKGKTTIYRVGRDKDVAAESYDWYSQSPFVLCHYRKNWDATVVARLGPYSEDHINKKTDLAIAFYKSGKLLAQYSVLDIAGSPSKVQDWQRYRPFLEVKGWIWMDDEGGKSCCSIFFVAVNGDGKTIRFSPYTGKRIPEVPPKQISQSPKKSKAPH